MNKLNLTESLHTAAWIALPCALFCLLISTLVLGSGIIEKLMPVFLTLMYAAISFALSRIPYTSKRLWLKAVIYAVVIAVTVIFLHS